MNATDFTALLKNPREVEGVDVNELREWAREYPYSQAMQFFYALRLKNSSEHLFDQQLGKASILTNDRSVLFDIFERDQWNLSTGRVPSRPPAPVSEELPKEAGSLEVKEAATEQKTPPAQAPPREKEEDASLNFKPDFHPEVSKVTSSQELQDKNLSASERIRLILEKNRNLRKEFESRNAGREISLSDRIKEIQSKHQSLQTEDLPPPQEEVPGEGAENAKMESLQFDELPPLPSATEEKDTESPGVEEKFTARVEQTSEPMDFAIDEPSEPGEVAEEPAPQSPKSFGDWLKKFQTEKREEEIEIPQKQDEKLNFQEKASLIDRFVQKIPELKSKGKNWKPAAAGQIHMGDISQQDDSALVTETLARVYIKQGHFEKAIKAYRILKLKYPEKSSFFADRISEINRLKNNK